MRDRILVVGRPGSGKLGLIKGLTGAVPDIPTDAVGHAGLSSEYKIENKYYSATVGVWIDEFGRTEDSTVTQWVNEFSSEQAREVRDVLGALIYTYDEAQEPTAKDAECIGQLVELLSDEGWDGIVLAVSKVEKTSDELQEKLFDLGFECTHAGSGEDGIARVREALEVFPWDGGVDGEDEEESSVKAAKIDDGEMPEAAGDGDVPKEVAEEESLDSKTYMEILKGLDDRELQDLTTPILGEEQVDGFETFISKLQKAKETGTNLSHDERTKLSEELADELLRIL